MLTLSPQLALVLFVVGVVAGHRYRRVWKQKGSSAEAWLFGSISAIGLLGAALIPVMA
ncbi:MAG: hypothetical protein AAF420_15325 [Pseudomonadota bacterium]